MMAITVASQVEIDDHGVAWIAGANTWATGATGTGTRGPTFSRRFSADRERRCVRNVPFLPASPLRRRITREVVPQTNRVVIAYF